ncbi:DUF6174 domain-containing protein [Thalassobellus citreus]|uniref:DUF6174 domain-containing protein n=1 Tax=Thalassobellus citreus TaxID=3367752 RepID=UPI0037B83565
MKKILLLSISFLLISCSNSDDSDDFTGLYFDQKTFEKNRQLWAENEILDYTFSQEYFSTSIGGQPKLTSVIKNKVLDTIFIQSGYATNNPIEELTYYGTIGDVFHYIEWCTAYYEDIINSNQSNMKGAEFTITYDETYHYPTEIKCRGNYFETVYGGLSIQIIFSDFEVK